MVGRVNVPAERLGTLFGLQAAPLHTRARILSSATAVPPIRYSQEETFRQVSELLFGSDWDARPDVAEQIHRLERLYSASGVEHRNFAVDPLVYHRNYPGTGQRMVDYTRHAFQLGREALLECTAGAGQGAIEAITDFVIVSCTGYTAPGLDVLLARDLGISPEARRTVIGHMGCAAGIVGLRNSLATAVSRERSVVALLAVELCSLHYSQTLDLGTLTAYALFADAAAAVMVSGGEAEQGPEIVDTYCASEFNALDQMTWTIGDQGFVMGLSIRVPVTLRRNVGRAMERLLSPHGLQVADIDHWLIHPGGPSIVEAVQDSLDLSDDQVMLSWEVLRERGNCSSATILLMLDRLLRSGRSRPGEWGVMMAFGPGLTLETCLLRF